MLDLGDYALNTFLLSDLTSNFLQKHGESYGAEGREKTQDEGVVASNFGYDVAKCCEFELGYLAKVVDVNKYI